MAFALVIKLPPVLLEGLQLRYQNRKNRLGRVGKSLSTYGGQPIPSDGQQKAIQVQISIAPVLLASTASLPR